MSAKVEFTGRCFGARLVLGRGHDDIWSMSLYTTCRKHSESRAIAFACANRSERPRVDPSDADTFTPASLWVGSACFDVPDSLVPKLQAFIAEHTDGSAA
ncbi:hypothetical protein [Stenotrophomonas nematodicola]|uniref:hypothetical protein n=1 Tax=Stenotrophomonas nematodicola TaxID=2656746 RepID=UPI003D9A2DA0